MPKENTAEVLLDILNSPSIKEDKKAQMQIDKILSEHGIEPGSLNEILVTNEKITELTDEEMCLLAMAVSDVIDDEDVFDYKKLYSANEIKKSKKYKRAHDRFKYPYTINGVLKGSDTMYSTFLPVHEIKKLWENGAITYNMDVQRLPKEKKRRDGTTYKIPDIKTSSVNTIFQLMSSGRYKSNSLILNILMDGNDEVEYEDGDLVIHEGTTVNIIDGAHRLEAAVKIAEQDPESEEMLPVLIYHLPLTEAQDALSQINTFNPFDKTLVKYYGNKKISDQIVKEIMSIPELSGRVRIKTAIPKNSKYLTNFAILSESIDKSFEPQNTKDRFEVASVLKKFFGYLISAFPKEFTEDLNKVRENSWINHHNTFYGYVFLAKKIYEKYGEDFPVSKITEAINGIDFRKEDGLPYNDIISPQGKVNANTIKKNIGEFFEGIEV